MTIGAFAKRTGLSVSAVRFYGDQQLLVPYEIDSSNGYRLYADAQVDNAILIRDLRRLEMSLRDIAAALELSESERQELVERHLHRLEETVMRAHDLARSLGANHSKRKTAMTASLQTTELAEALDQVLPAAGTDPERPHLMSVLVEGKDGSIRFVATDSYRLAVRDLVPSSLTRDFRAVVPAATLQQWRKTLDGSVELGLRLHDGQLELSGHGADLTARAVPITFPDYEKFLAPMQNVTAAKVDRKALIAALEDVGSGDTLTMTASDSALSVSVDQGRADVEAAVEGPPRVVVINGRFLADAIQNAVGPEVIIEIEDPLRAVLFRSADDGTFTSWVMPVKPE